MSEQNEGEKNNNERFEIFIPWHNTDGIRCGHMLIKQTNVRPPPYTLRASTLR